MLYFDSIFGNAYRNVRGLGKPPLYFPYGSSMLQSRNLRGTIEEP